MGRPGLFPAGEEHNHALDRQTLLPRARRIALGTREEHVVLVDAKRHLRRHRELPLDVKQPRAAADRDLERPIEAALSPGHLGVNPATDHDRIACLHERARRRLGELARDVA